MAMRPRDRGPEPVPVEARAYFSEAQIEKAEAFRTGKLWIYARPDRDRARRARRCSSGGRRSGSPGCGGRCSRAPPSRSAISVAERPRGAAALGRGARAGQGRRPRHPGLGRVGRRPREVEAIAAGFAALGGAVLVFGMRRFGRALVDPGRGRGGRLRRDHDVPEPDRARPAVQRLQARPARRAALRRARARASEAGVDVGEVYEMDASRRTTAANAYVTGLGHTKRVVLYDTLVDDFTPGETHLVVAHELGHVRHHDVRNGLHLGRDRGAVRHAGPWRCWPQRLAPRGGELGPARRARGALSLAIVVPVDHDGLQPALARRRAARGRVLARADARSRRRSSTSSAGSRSRTSPTPIRRPSPASCSAPTRRRWSGSAWRRRSRGEVHGAGGREAPPAVRRRRGALPEDAVRPRPRRAWSRCATTSSSSAGSPRAPTACCSTARGRTCDSVAFARWLEDRRQRGLDVCFVVGGADGIELEPVDETALVRADDVPAPARPRHADRAALPRPQDPGGRAVPSLSLR